MKKNDKGRLKKDKGAQLTVGLDLGDRSSRYCILDEMGEVVVDGSFASTKKGLDQVTTRP